jgi:dipeptidyl aminopeptidase/acylaminoacyl peptidase
MIPTHPSRIVRASAAAVLLGVSVALPVAAQDAPRAMTLVDLVELPSLSDPQLSPDGSRIAFVRSEADWEGNRTVRHVWSVGVDGNDELQLTRGEEGESSPRWSPDGDWIAFLADRSEDGPTQIHLLRTLGGEAMELTDHPTSVSSIQWAPDGSALYFVAADEKSEEEQRKERLADDVYAYDEDYQHRHLWRVAVPSGETEKITSGDWSLLGYRLSRDGTMVAHHRGPNPLFGDFERGEVWVMDADGGNAVRLTENGVAEGGATLSPDNRQVVFTSGSRGDLGESYFNTNVFLVPAEGGEVRELAPGMGHGLDAVEWSADGEAIYVLANTGVRDQLFRLDLASEEMAPVTEGDHQLGSWSYHADADAHLFTRRSGESPGDVWTADASGMHQVTRVFDDLDERFRLPREESVTWDGEDGVEVEGLLYYPLEYVEGQRYPLVVQTHGGPASSDQFGEWGSYDYVQVLTDLGYFVLKPNYRGSTGYGDDFLRNMVGSYFDQAHLDVMAGVDHLIDEGLVDGDRMAKMGWSAGGHMTNKIITFTDRFRAASSGAGAANWISMYAQSDVRTYRTPWFGGTPWEEDAPLEVYREHSPLFQVHEVTTPTIFLVGAEDVRVPPPQSVEMWRGVQAQGVPTHLYVAPREPHGWRELRHLLFKANVELEWFERWVMDREWEWETAPGDEEAGTEDAVSP